MSNVLMEICERKRDEVEARKLSRPLSAFKEHLTDLPLRGFAHALKSVASQDRLALIAEIKKASPSRGLIRDDFDPEVLARAYELGGATCLSVLTEGQYFQGSDGALSTARAATSLPCLRKDFTIDPYQIYEARTLSADAVLLIVAALTDEQIQSFTALAEEIGLDVLIEVHDRDELNRALKVDTAMVGINNRNLKTLKVRTETTLELAPLVPSDRLIVAESGLSSYDDLRRMRDAGATAFLVGESLMRADNVTAATQKLLGEHAVS
ncbi:MAG: indole-3-glycerol phosphate synthase TrpC [Pseudomonadota bacterium]